MKNLAGNTVSIFLFRFVKHRNGISFVLNEAIAEDMYPDIDEKVKPLAHACCETLLRYQHLSVGNTVMDGNILVDDSFEVMLSKGLGKHFAEPEKQNLFLDAKKIADLLILVMDRKDLELEHGQVVEPSKPHNQENVKNGLERLAQEKNLLSELEWLADGKSAKAGLKQLRPDDLPVGVRASRGYDHRGHCLILNHHTLGEIGKIILSKAGADNTLVQAELYIGQDDQKSIAVTQRKEILETVVSVINNLFSD